MSFGVLCTIQIPIKLGKFWTEAIWGVLICGAQMTSGFILDTSAKFGGAKCLPSKQARSKVLQ